MVSLSKPERNRRACRRARRCALRHALRQRKFKSLRKAVRIALNKALRKLHKAKIRRLLPKLHQDREDRRVLCGRLLELERERVELLIQTQNRQNILFPTEAAYHKKIIRIYIEDNNILVIFLWKVFREIELEELQNIINADFDRVQKEISDLRRPNEYFVHVNSSTVRELQLLNPRVDDWLLMPELYQNPRNASLMNILHILHSHSFLVENIDILQSEPLD